MLDDTYGVVEGGSLKLHCEKTTYTWLVKTKINQKMHKLILD